MRPRAPEVDFGSQIGAKMEPECDLKSLKKAPRNSEEKALKKGTQNGAQTAPRGALGSPKRLHGTLPGDLRRRPGSPGLSRDLPGASWEPSRVTFSLILMIFGRKIKAKRAIISKREKKIDRKRKEAAATTTLRTPATATTTATAVLRTATATAATAIAE